MLIFKEKGSLHQYLSQRQRRGETVGFVPTMGALHAGHLSLLQAASARSDIVVCSIFVNPTQFNDREDYERYPVRTEDDIRKLLDTPADILFLPAVHEIYPEDPLPSEVYDFGSLETVLEGASRPGHFQGVGQVMRRLLDIMQPDLLFMGQKDYQQILIINKLVNILKNKAKVISCPVIREADGLAMSSRNVRLSENARRKAPVIHETLLFIKENFQKISFPGLIERATGRMEAAGLGVDYLVIADRDRLQTLQHPVHAPMICLAAARLDGVRLIDNVFL